MAYEQKNLSGVLFVNNDKQKESHPDYKGNATINGVEYWLSGWKKQSRDGSKKFLSLAFKPKMAQEHRGAPRNPPPRQADDPGFGDDSPF